MKIRRRFPNSFSGYEDQETEHDINNKEELLEIDWIKHLTEMPRHIGMFYSPSSYTDSPNHLMHLSKGKDSVIYFVVGYIFGDGAELGLEDYKNHI